MFPGISGKQVAAAATLYVEDVFSAFTYTGNAAVRSIVNGIDLAGKGGMVWNKPRSSGGHLIVDTNRGRNSVLDSSSAAAAVGYSMGGANQFNAFNSDGYTLGNDSIWNGNGTSYVSWTFRKARKFFDVVTYTGNGVAGRQIAHDLGCEPGMIIVKNLSITNHWVVYHRSVGALKYLRLSGTDAATTYSGEWNNTEPTSTEFTVGNASEVNANGNQYVAYLLAHDTSSDGIIQCGNFTGLTTVNLGWEPQYLLIKNIQTSDTNWMMFDSSRGFTLGNDNELRANLTGAEDSAIDVADPTATGFKTKALYGANGTHVYMAIRKGLMRTPTDASKVFDIVARTGNSGETVVTTTIKSGVDLAFFKCRNTPYFPSFMDRVRGPGAWLTSSLTNAEESQPTTIKSFNQNGVTVGAGIQVNESGAGSYINYFFKQARGFFDIVGYTGTGVAHTEKHNLGAAPELIIVKRRNGSQSWGVFAQPLGAGKYLGLNLTNAQISDAAIWNNTLPTDEVFSVGSSAVVSNNNGDNHIAYLFASCPGVSKIGTYVGNKNAGTYGNNVAQTINCGFVAGARFLMIKRVSGVGNWIYFDTARGLGGSGTENDPKLAMNLSSAEYDTSQNCIVSAASGFSINDNGTDLLNLNGETYLYFAIA
jgi:hypothetical protein